MKGHKTVHGRALEETYDSFSEDDLEDNPFKIPTDEQIFERKEKEKSKTMKGNALFSSPRRNKYTKKESAILPLLNDKKVRSAPSGENPQNPGFKKKENVGEFIEKKKQMFLLQMSIDTKNFEVKKLDKKAEKREQKLFQMEQELKQQTQAFDDFLALNDIRAVEAIKKAEEETKAKQAKQNDIKKLNARVTAINGEISKLDDQLDHCRRYKDFLDSLTPKEELEKIEAAKKKKREKSQHQKHSSRSSKSNIDEEKRETTMTQVAPIEIGEPEEEEEEADDMFFKRPEQLLNIYSELEESNLILMQSTEEIQEQLEDIQKVYKETKFKM